MTKTLRPTARSANGPRSDPATVPARATMTKRNWLADTTTKTTMAVAAAYKPPKSKSKSKGKPSGSSRRSSSAAYRDDMDDSDAYGTDGDFTAKPTESSRRSRA